MHKLFEFKFELVSARRRLVNIFSIKGVRK